MQTSERVTVTLPRRNIELARRTAEQRGSSLSAYVADAVRRQLVQDALTTLAGSPRPMDEEWAAAIDEVNEL